MADTSPSECEIETALTADIVNQLSAIPNPVWEWDVSDTASCELEAGHSGRHASKGETCEDDDNSLWIVWDEDLPVQLERRQPCESTPSEDPDDLVGEELCILPNDHDGQHTDGTDWWND